MAYYFSAQHPHVNTHSSSSSTSSASSQIHHVARSRRAPRFSSAHGTAHRPFRGVRSMKELTEAASMAAFRTRFEAGRSFDLDDDLEFCPALLTEDDLHVISSPSSDRSSLSSNSPDSSPQQQQVQPSQQVVAPALMNHATSHPTLQYRPSSQMKIHQPSALRMRNAIPIVNPSTGMRVPSPPESISPGMNGMGRRW